MIICSECKSENPGEATTCMACGASPIGPDNTTEVPMQDIPKPQPEPISFQDGRYEVKDLLGQGSTKRVYLAHDTLLDRDVAFARIAVGGLDPAYRERVLREAQVLAELSAHPNIVQIFDFGEDEGQLFMVLPVLAGGSLEQIMRSGEEKPLELDVALRVATDVSQGLEFAHSNGIVHRDIKLGNIWLREDGMAQLGDFGLAFSTAYSRLTEQGTLFGTFAYIAPELAMGSEIDPLSDLYSLGVVVYEMVVGRPPFQAEHAVALIGHHLNTPPVPPCELNPQCPDGLDDLVLRLLAKEPADRPQSAIEVLQDLEEITKMTVAATPAAGEVRGKPLRVLIVEDSESDAMLLSHQLRRYPQKVCKQSGGVPSL